MEVLKIVKFEDGERTQRRAHVRVPSLNSTAQLRTCSPSPFTNLNLSTLNSEGRLKTMRTKKETTEDNEGRKLNGAKSTKAQAKRLWPACKEGAEKEAEGRMGERKGRFPNF